MKGEMEVEVLKDPSDAESLKKARRRQRLIESSAQEIESELFDNNGGRRNTRPGAPSKGVY